MISPTLLTPSNGFEDGVLVEIVHRHSEGSKVIHGVMGNKDISLTLYSDLHSLPIGIQYSDILSIRPLTGPMSIWCHAPGWATYCCESEASGTWYSWCWEPKEAVTKNWERITARPFWATRSGE